MPINWLTKPQGEGWGEVIRNFVLNTPFGVSTGSKSAPQWTLGSALQPMIERGQRREGMAALQKAGVLPEDIDLHQWAGMDPSMVHMGLRFLENRGRESSLKDFPGAVEAIFPGVKVPKPTRELGILPPTMGEGPSLNITTGLSPEEQSAYDQIAAIRMPRKDIAKSMAEHHSGRALADQLRRQFPEDADLIDESVSRVELSALRGDLMKRREQRLKDAKEQANADALAKQFGLPPGLPLDVTKKAFEVKQSTERLGAILDRQTRSLTHNMNEWDRRRRVLDEMKRQDENRKEVKDAEKSLWDDLNREIRHTETLLKDYKTTSIPGLAPHDATIHELDLQLRELKQCKRAMEREKIQKSGKPQSKGGVKEFEELFQ